MKKEILVKLANTNNIKNEILNVGFDNNYIKCAESKYKNITLKLFDLKAPEANILKQLCLSLGFDCAVSKNTICCKCEYTDCILNGTIYQVNKLIEKLKIQPYRLKKLAKELKIILSRNNEPQNSLFIQNKKYIVGILNITPDSFSDGGEYSNLNCATQRAIELIEQGADIIDIGGESTRPNAQLVDIEEEISRVIPVIKEIRKHNKEVLISVDTRNFQTAKSGIESGANIINDVTALNHDEKLKEYVIFNNIPVILMHSESIPAITPRVDSEEDIVEKLHKFFYYKIQDLTSKGLDINNIILDPGIGFSKSINENFEIIKRINEFKTLNCKILMGISRKSFLKSTNTSDIDLDEITTLYNMSMIKNGVDFIRVHDVKRHKRNLNYLEKLL